MFTDLRLMLAYVFPAMVVVLGASERVLAARLAAYGRPPAHHFAPDRLATVPTCSNRLYMFPDLRLYWNMHLLLWWLCLVPPSEF
jgi:hypothetical protein